MDDNFGGGDGPLGFVMPEEEGIQPFYCCKDVSLETAEHSSIYRRYVRVISRPKFFRIVF